LIAQRNRLKAARRGEESTEAAAGDNWSNGDETPDEELDDE
jgi:hypothetical protein